MQNVYILEHRNSSHMQHGDSLSSYFNYILVIEKTPFETNLFIKQSQDPTII